MKEVRVRVKPNSKREYVEEAPHDTLRVGVDAPSEENRANERLRELIAEYHDVPVKNVIIVKGSRSPNKLLRIYP